MNRISSLISIIVVSGLLSACGGSSSNSTASADADNGNGMDNEAMENSGGNSAPETGGTSLVPLDAIRAWALGPASYQVTDDAATAQQSSETRVVIVISTSGFDGSNGLYSGSGVSMTLNAVGAGDYTLTDTSTLVSLGDSVRAGTLTVTAGTLNVNPLRNSTWEATTGTVSVRVGEDGRYHVSTTEPLTLTRNPIADFNGGIPDSPDQISFTMQNLHARPASTQSIN